MTLYLVPTPIGNLSDISDRCRETLQSVDFIAAEDTRVTLRLLNHMGIKKPLVSYYEHNKEVSGPKIVERLLGGRELRAGHGCRFPGHLRPRRGSGAALRRGGRDRHGHSRPSRCDHRAEHLRAADGSVRLRGLHFPPRKRAALPIWIPCGQSSAQ